MSRIQYERHKCDCCGKEEDIQFGSRPLNWYEIEITKWHGNSGEGVFNKEVCSKKCALEILSKVKKIPNPKPRKMICHY